MWNQSDQNANRSPEPPLTRPGAPLDSERAKQPPLPEPPYKPYSEKTLLHAPHISFFLSLIHI